MLTVYTEDDELVGEHIVTGRVGLQDYPDAKLLELKIPFQLIEREVIYQGPSAWWWLMMIVFLGGGGAGGFFAGRHYQIKK